jgi:hypothetical protein
MPFRQHAIRPCLAGMLRHKVKAKCPQVKPTRDKGHQIRIKKFIKISLNDN